MNYQRSIAQLKHYKKIHNLSQDISQTEMEMLHENVPIQKIVGFINFDNLVINVKHRVLIPRYETQEVLNYALSLFKNHPNRSQLKVLDLGCGSGYIGLSIKQQLNCQVTLSDIDMNAIQQTVENAHLNNLDVKIVHSDMFENITGKYNLVISNPPYIPEKTQLDVSVLKHEPSIALFGGENGNFYYQKILENVHNFLEPQGFLVLEISEENVAFLKSHHFSFLQDINQKYRIAFKQFI